jgi:hypothetical protein
LRFACALDWLVETSPDVFALTRFSLVLATNPAARCYFESLSLQNSRATAAFYDNATDPKTRESESAAETAWSQGMGDVLKPGQGVWDYFGQNDAEMAQFAHGMAFGVSAREASGAWAECVPDCDHCRCDCRLSLGYDRRHHRVSSAGRRRSI